MILLQTTVLPRCSLPFCATKVYASLQPLSSFNIQNPNSESTDAISRLGFFLSSPIFGHRNVKPISCSVVPRKSHSGPEPEPSSNPRARHKARNHQSKNVGSSGDDKSSAEVFPTTIPRKPRRGHRSESMAVEDFIRELLQRTFDSIRQQNLDVLENKENIMKDRVHDKSKSEGNDDDDDEKEEEKEEEDTGDGRVKKMVKDRVHDKSKSESSYNDDDNEGEEEEEEEDTGDGRGKMVIEEESKDWPLDADVGWGTRASEYFEKHPIKNVVGENGVEIDWEGELDDNWVQEINCLEWESFAFHPSPLIVLVFERYHRATDNWKNLKELEEAVKVYWRAKDWLPPRAVKIDINIERDLAYALKVRECPQILFLRGNRILYRERELRTADELVQMIAFFYYNAKKPSWIDGKALKYRY